MRAPVVIVEFLNPQHLYHPVLECLLRVALGGAHRIDGVLEPSANTSACAPAVAEGGVEGPRRIFDMETISEDKKAEPARCGSCL